MLLVNRGIRNSEITLVRSQKPFISPLSILSLYVLPIWSLILGRDLMESPIVEKNSFTGTPNRSRGFNIFPKAFMSDSVFVVAVSIFAPVIIKKTLVVLRDAIARPSSVIMKDPILRTIFPCCSITLLMNVNTRKRPIGIHPLLIDRKGNLQSSIEIAINIRTYIVRSFIRNRLMTNPMYKMILISGDNEILPGTGQTVKFCDLLNDRCRSDISIKTRGN